MLKQTIETQLFTVDSELTEQERELFYTSLEVEFNRVFGCDGENARKARTEMHGNE